MRIVYYILQKNYQGRNAMLGTPIWDCPRRLDKLILQVVADEG